MRRIALIASAVCCAGGPARAYPNGAPWGAADPDGAAPCASCHSGAAPVLQSDALAIEAPDCARPGEAHRMALRYRDAQARIAGFQAMASAGAFVVVDDAHDRHAGAVRSTEPQRMKEGEARFALQWVAPDALHEPVTFLVAVNGANDDASAFGDATHYKSVAVKRC